MPIFAEKIICSVFAIVFSVFAFFGMFFSEVTDIENKKDKIKAMLKRKKTEWLFFAVLPVITVSIPLVYYYVYADLTIIYCLKRSFLISVLFVAAFHDHKDFRIPNKLILYGFIMRIVMLIFELIFSREQLLETVITELIAAVSMFLICMLTRVVIRGGIGMGDVKLIMIMGLFQGVVGTISSIFATMLVSFVYSVFLIATKKKTKKDSIAFAPCIAVGAVISIILTGA